MATATVRDITRGSQEVLSFDLAEALTVQGVLDKAGVSRDDQAVLIDGVKVSGDTPVSSETDTEVLVIPQVANG